MNEKTNNYVTRELFDERDKAYVRILESIERNSGLLAEVVREQSQTLERVSTIQENAVKRQDALEEKVDELRQKDANMIKTVKYSVYGGLIMLLVVFVANVFLGNGTVL